MRILQPPNWPRPKGYSNGVAARGQMVFVSGMVGWDEHGNLLGAGFVAQARQALTNIVSVLKEAGAHPKHLVRMTWYILDRDEYLDSLKNLGVAYRDIIGPYYPAMTAIEVGGFMEKGARVEIEATAVIPD